MSSDSCLSQKSSMVSLDSLPMISQERNHSAKKTEFLPGSFRGKYASKLILVFGRIQFLTVVGL